MKDVTTGRHDVELFEVGAVYATPAVLEHLWANGTSPILLVARHESGDWGELCEDDLEANRQAIRTGARILSLYTISSERVYLITEAAGENHRRASTTLLLAREY